MRHAPHLPPHETRIQAAWPAPLATAVHPPGLRPELIHRRDELRPRVAAYYT
jgi:hypothetical protein